MTFARASTIAVNSGCTKDPRHHISPTYTHKLQSLFDAYRQETMAVSFRELVGVLPADDLTHGTYPYPARMLRHIPHFMLATQQIMEGIDYVVDPFCGSGTILLEAQRRYYQSYGFDQNPIAALVSRVKTTPRNAVKLFDAFQNVVAEAKRTRRTFRPPSYLYKWYADPAFSILSRLCIARTDIDTGPATDYIDLCIALLARKLSIADPRIPVPVRLQDVPQMKSAKLWDICVETGREVATRVARLQSQSPRPFVAAADARNSETWDVLPKSSGGLLFTSPPYGASQKYIRSSSLEAGWLGFSSDRGTKCLERHNIGREHISQREVKTSRGVEFSESLNSDLAKIRDRDPRRGEIYDQYFADMAQVFTVAARQPGLDTVVLVAGDNVVTDIPIPTNAHLANMLRGLGFRDIVSLQDPIRGRTLITRRHNGRQPTAAEYIWVFKR